MPQLAIPACGDRITLTQKWTFQLRLEYRNVEFAKQLGLMPTKEEPGWTARYRHADKVVECTLPRGTTLEFDRVYIRQHNKAALSRDEDYNSITFKVVGKKKQRFWVKLSDANKIRYTPDSNYEERVKIVARLTTHASAL